MKLVERMPRVCKAVIKAKGGYFFGYYMIPYVLFHSFDVNKEKLLTGTVCKKQNVCHFQLQTT